MKKNKSVYLVQHLLSDDEFEDVKIVGIYDSKQNAESAVQRLKTVNGFKDNPGGFSIDEYPLNQDFWSEGF